MHAWCECTHDHDMNEDNKINEEGRGCESLGHCEVASETLQDGSWVHGDVLQPSSRSSSSRRHKNGF